MYRLLFALSSRYLLETISVYIKKQKIYSISQHWLQSCLRSYQMAIIVETLPVVDGAVIVVV